MDKLRLSVESLSVTSFHTGEAQPAGVIDTGIMTFATLCFFCPVKQPGTSVSGVAQ